MSSQINLSSKVLIDAYHDVLNNRGINSALFTYRGGTNILEVQSRGIGGLEEFQELLSDKRLVVSRSRVVIPGRNV